MQRMFFFEISIDLHSQDATLSLIAVKSRQFKDLYREDVGLQCVGAPDASD